MIESIRECRVDAEFENIKIVSTGNSQELLNV